MFHVFGYNINWSMFWANTIQLHQIWMLKFTVGYENMKKDNRQTLIEFQLKEMTMRLTVWMTYVMTFASSMKSSSDIVPPFIILTAVSIDPRHFPRRTTPNWPEPSSSSNINSDGWISHLSCDKPAVGGTGRSHGDDFNRHAKPPELWRW